MSIFLIEKVTGLKQFTQEKVSDFESYEKATECRFEPFWQNFFRLFKLNSYMYL